MFSNPIDVIRKNKVAFYFSIVYVCLGGIVACSLYPNDPLNGNWWIWGWLLTFPVNIFSVAYRAEGSMDYLPVLLIQLFVLIPTFIISKRLLQGKSSNKKENK